MIAMSKTKSKQKDPGLSMEDLRPVQEVGFPSEEASVEPVEVVVEPKPRQKNFIPRDCVMCIERRKQDGKEGQSFVTTYGKSGKLRYCRCGFCKHTWKELGNS